MTEMTTTVSIIIQAMRLLRKLFTLLVVRESNAWIRCEQITCSISYDCTHNGGHSTLLNDRKGFHFCHETGPVSHFYINTDHVTQRKSK